MAQRIRVRVGGVTAEGQLFEDKAPRTVAALWSRLPSDPYRVDRLAELDAHLFLALH